MFRTQENDSHHHDLSFSSTHLSDQTLEKVTKISTVPDRWSRCLCELVDGIFSVRGVNISRQFEFFFIHFRVIGHQTQQNLQSLRIGIEAIKQHSLKSQPPTLIPAVGDWKRAIPLSVVQRTSRITHHATTRRFGKGLRRTHPIPDS